MRQNGQDARIKVIQGLSFAQCSIMYWKCLKLCRFPIFPSFSYYAPQREKHIRHRFVCLSVSPVPCPANNLKTTVGIQMKFGL